MISFYLLIAPAILFDKDEYLKAKVDYFRQKIQNILGGQELVCMPKEDKMPVEALNKLKKFLS